jgi:hypothetical protein
MSPAFSDRRESQATYCLFNFGVLVGLIFDREYGGDALLRNVYFHCTTGRCIPDDRPVFIIVFNFRNTQNINNNIANFVFLWNVASF